MDDFVRNFLVRMGLTATLEKFETEWYELEATGRLNKEDMGVVPDVYNYNQELNEQCNALRAEVNAQKAVVAKATATWEKFRKERDLHRMHHKRIGQEKNKLLGDIKKLKKHYAQYEPTIKELKRKYELAMKEKMLTRIEKDRLEARIARHRRRRAAKKATDTRAKAEKAARAAAARRGRARKKPRRSARGRRFVCRRRPPRRARLSRARRRAPRARVRPAGARAPGGEG